MWLLKREFGGCFEKGFRALSCKWDKFVFERDIPVFDSEFQGFTYAPLAYVAGAHI